MTLKIRKTTFKSGYSGCSGLIICCDGYNGFYFIAFYFWDTMKLANIPVFIEPIMPE
jgi:hypothetical protein